MFPLFNEPDFIRSEPSVHYFNSYTLRHILTFKQMFRYGAGWTQRAAGKELPVIRRIAYPRCIEYFFLLLTVFLSTTEFLESFG